MSKIVKAINVMVSNQNLITNVIRGAHDTEFFFIYDQKHTWSILRTSTDGFILRYYPGDVDIAMIASITDEEWMDHEPTNVMYSSKDLGTKEAHESLKDLYNIAQEKVFGMDDVLDDIIESDVPF